jgi:hypothetical protein
MTANLQAAHKFPGTGRVPHVRPSVRGPKKISSTAFTIGLTKPRVPHISLVFREMWDTTNLNVS